MLVARIDYERACYQLAEVNKQQAEFKSGDVYRDMKEKAQLLAQKSYHILHMMTDGPVRAVHQQFMG